MAVHLEALETSLQICEKTENKRKAKHNKQNHKLSLVLNLAQVTITILQPHISHSMTVFITGIQPTTFLLLSWQFKEMSAC